MSEPKKRESGEVPHGLIAVSAGLAAIIGLATLFRMFGRVSGASPSLPVGSYFLACVGWPFLIAYFVVCVGLGWALRGNWMAALGMMLPLPISLVLEFAEHNLWPIEIIMVWLPAFGLARLGVFLGGFLASMKRQSAPPNSTG